MITNIKLTFPVWEGKEITAVEKKIISSLLFQGQSCKGRDYSLFKQHSSLYCTFLCWVHCGNWAEGPLPSIVVRPHFHVKRWEWWDGIIAEDVACHTRCGNNRSRPRDCAHRPEGDDVAEALSVLQFLGNRLGAKHKTIVILKRIQTKKQTGPSLRCTSTRASTIRHFPSFFVVFTLNTLQSPFLPYLFLLHGYVIVAKVQNSSERVLSGPAFGGRNGTRRLSQRRGVLL